MQYRPETVDKTSASYSSGFAAILIIVWFFTLQPFLSPITVSTDLQPFSLLLASICLGIDSLYRNRLVRKLSYILLFSLGVELIHYTTFGGIAGVYLATYIYSVFTLRFSSIITGKVVIVVMTIHLLGLIWQTLEPSSFSNIVKFFLRDMKYSGITSRGATGFTPEPSFAGALATGYAVIYFRFFAAPEKRLMNFIFFLMYVLCLILTSSSLGYFFFPFVLLIMFGKNRNFKIINIFYIIIGSFIVLFLARFFLENYQTNQRGLKLLMVLFEDPMGLLLDGSLQERTRSLFIGFHTMIDTLYGLGHGNFALATSLIENQFDLNTLFDTSRVTAGSASGLGNVMLGTGFLGVSFFLGVFIGLRGLSTFADIGVWVIALAMFTFSFSPAFPLIYILLVMRWKNENFYIH